MGKEGGGERGLDPPLNRHDGECYQMVTQTPCDKPLFLQLLGLCHYIYNHRSAALSSQFVYDRNFITRRNL